MRSITKQGKRKMGQTAFAAGNKITVDTHGAFSLLAVRGGNPDE
jgi:hypothetical protein